MSTLTAVTPPPLRATRRAQVAFVGAGPGDLGLLTVRARDYLAAAEVVLLDSIHEPEQLSELTRQDATLVPVRRAGRAGTEAARAKLVVRTARALSGGALVVRLMDGDPAACSGLATEALACRRAGLPIEIVPGVSSAWSVPAYAGVPLTGHGVGALHVVDAADPHDGWERSTADDTCVVVLGTPPRLRKALAGLLKAGRDPHTPVLVTHNGTTTVQRSQVGTLREVSSLLTGSSTRDQCVVVVGEQVQLRQELSWYETKPLFGWRVLLPRTNEDAGPMTDRVAWYGATSSVVPTMSVQPPRTPQQMDRAVKGLVTGRFEWVGFTSVNAVKAVREKLIAVGLDARVFAGLKLAAVGGATADSLRDWGLEPDLVPDSDQSARGLLEQWPAHDDLLDPINRVFLPRADIATDTLVAGLHELGWEVDHVTAYRTVRAAPPPARVREQIKGGHFDAVCFSSSSTVRNLVGIAGKPHPNTLVACIGPATAKTAGELGLRVDVVSPRAAPDALVDALADLAQQNADAATAAGEPVCRPSSRPTRRTGAKASAKARSRAR